MFDIIKKNWITSLGVVFVFMAFVYFLKMAIDFNWVPPTGRAAIGLVLGLSCLFSGYKIYLKKKNILSEIIAGLGVSVMYATFSYASFSDQINWSSNALLISILALSSLVVFISYKYEMRILIFISVLGGLFSPLIIKAQLHHITALFFYVATLNIASLYISVVKKWTELRIMPFIATLAIYISYYVFFDPESWGKPFFYAVSLFMVYLVGTVFASWKEKDRNAGLNIYLGLINAVNFVFWSVFIFSSFTISYTIPLLITGTTFLGAAVAVYFLLEKTLFSSIAYFALGILLMAVSGADIGDMSFSHGMNYVVSSLVWLLLLAVVYIAGVFTKFKQLRYVSLSGWALLLVYWGFVAWDVEWVRWFGVEYIPFINPGAIVWIALATFGFYYSMAIKKEKADLSLLIGIVSHVVVGGLFTVQIQNIWKAYAVTNMSVGLMLSVSWALYALCIFLWGAYYRCKVFRIMGSVVLGMVSVKVFLFDLGGAATFEKVLFLLIMGVITFVIAFVNQRWSASAPKTEHKTEGGPKIEQEIVDEDETIHNSIAGGDAENEVI